ncbi:uncharacterized protein LOC119680703 [Teleopsis dalmanni]|uniref:uncharacterized protein LOC119680703 n=1 Tax=Teleopsis dalmanni TaxID=139649 RepID=UPI0018CED131|nr:uncharacterized protein LOC119680703 [Teleopsis dalmanni]XP_037949578.1 uncharacterized protein LOC119680703 [Teleopsis dalmanni]
MSYENTEYFPEEFKMLYEIAGGKMYTTIETSQVEEKHKEVQIGKPVKMAKKRIAHVPKYIDDVEVIAIDYNPNIESRKIPEEQTDIQRIISKQKLIDKVIPQMADNTLVNCNDVLLSNSENNRKRKRTDRNVCAAKQVKLELSGNMMENCTRPRKPQKQSVKENMSSNLQNVVAGKEPLKPQKVRQ